MVKAPLEGGKPSSYLIFLRRRAIPEWGSEMVELLAVREESAIEEDLDIYVSETVDCLICGAKFSQLNRHLQYTHKVTVQEYRAKYNNASIVSEAVANKRKASVCKSWEHADERREKFSTTFKENNPASNLEIQKKISTYRKAQGNPWKNGCNCDGTPCQNPLCYGKIHPNTKGEANPHTIKVRTDPVYAQLLVDRAHEKRASGKLGYKDGCIRDGKTICPNCNKLHKKFSPDWWTSSQEPIVCKILDGNGIKYRNNSRVPGLLQTTEQFSNLADHPFDIVIEDIKTIVEVQGCYFHMCPICSAKIKKVYIEHPEKDRWHLIENIARNAEIKRQVEAAGWTYEEIWEHEINEKQRRKYLKLLQGAN